MPQTVRILRGFSRYTKGQLVTIGGGVADVWIRMGRAEAAPGATGEPAPEIRTAALEPVSENADRTPRRRRKP